MENPETDHKDNVQYKDLAGKHLTFKLAGEFYGIEILKVKEIIGLSQITKVPRTKNYVKGVINLRGKVMPVIDLRIKFGLKEEEYTERTCIFIIQFTEYNQQQSYGVIVDEVSEVIFLSEEDIEPPPSFGSDIELDFIVGMGKSEKRVIQLLDIKKVLTGEEFICSMSS